MTPEEAKKEIEALAKASKKFLGTPVAARAFLIKHGFINKKGGLTKRYGG